MKISVKQLIITLAALSFGITASAQSKGKSDSFTLGQWIEIHNHILGELSKSYVDSLDVNRIEKAGTEAMLWALDPYTVYIPKEENEDLQIMINKSYGGIGAVIFKPGADSSLFISEPYAGSPAAKAGLGAGDEILTIDALPVKGLTANGCTEKMRGKPGTKVVFSVKRVRTGVVEDVTVTREKIHLPDVEYYGMLDDTTGYIMLTGFTETASSEIKSAFLKLKDSGMSKLVLDLRGNGGGLMIEAVNIVSLFVPKGSLVVSQKGRDDKSKVEYRTTLAPIDTEIPIVVLVDSGSASSSEILSGALQDLDRATIMGMRTYGKGLIQQIVKLPYDSQLKLTTGRYYTPSGRCVQAIDYSNRAEDGSVGHIPDSLTHEFRTASGRIVKDGGGITPDVQIPSKTYGRIFFSMRSNQIFEQYALRYLQSHESIPAVDEFRLSDADYEDFIQFAKTKKFDYRSNAKTLLDMMKDELVKDGMGDVVKEELSQLDKAINMDKEQMLRSLKSSIIPFLEEEIVVRYYFQEAGIKVRLRYDEQLQKALQTPLVVGV